jgi:hypothetical protein
MNQNVKAYAVRLGICELTKDVLQMPMSWLQRKTDSFVGVWVTYNVGMEGVDFKPGKTSRRPCQSLEEVWWAPEPARLRKCSANGAGGHKILRSVEAAIQ